MLFRVTNRKQKEKLNMTKIRAKVRSLQQTLQASRQNMFHVRLHKL